MKKAVLILVLISFVGFLYWIFKESTKPLPGEKISEMGRDHVADIYGVSYNSNPPTSGTHFPTWAGRGVYDRVLSDGYIIHSLEHGYIVISYNCEKLKTGNAFFIKEALAHEDEEPVEDSTESAETDPLMHMKFKGSGGMSFFTPESAPEAEVTLPDSFNSQACKDLIENLSSLTDGKKRIVIVPRVNLEVPIALTAWQRILKLNNFDKDQMVSFIKSFEGMGPEKTNE